MNKKEREIILSVPTTKKQARQIKKRNEQALEAFNELFKKAKKYEDFEESTVIEIGCPHCQEASGIDSWYDCENCAFSVLKEEDEEKDLWIAKEVWCCKCSFKGVSFMDIFHNSRAFITLRENNIEVWIRFYYSFEQIEEYIIPEVHAVRNFLKGHIEWANLVLEGKERP